MSRGRYPAGGGRQAQDAVKTRDLSRKDSACVTRAPRYRSTFRAGNRTGYGRNPCRQGRLLLGLLGAIGLAGQIAAAPPVNPLVEGREPDPVAREYYRDDAPAGRYVAPVENPGQPTPAAVLVLSAIVWDLLLDRLTIPLGTAAMPEAVPPCGA